MWPPRIAWRPLVSLGFGCVIFYSFCARFGFLTHLPGLWILKAWAYIYSGATCQGLGPTPPPRGKQIRQPTAEQCAKQWGHPGGATGWEPQQPGSRRHARNPTQSAAPMHAPVPHPQTNALATGAHIPRSGAPAGPAAFFFFVGPPRGQFIIE